MYCALDYIIEAATSLIEAKDIFIAQGHKSRTVECFMKLSDVYSYLQDKHGCYDAAQAAQRNLNEIDDEALTAGALLYSGQYHWFVQQREISRDKLFEAQRMYLKLNRSLGVAHCTYWISRTHYGEKNFIEARRTAEEAFMEYERLNHRDSAAASLIHLCRILKDIGCYDEAFRKTLRGVRMYQDIGGPSCIAQGLELLGHIYVKMGQYDEACMMYEQSIETFRPILGTFIARLGTAHCLYGIAQARRHQLRFEDAKRADVEFEDMEIDITLYGY